MTTTPSKIGKCNIFLGCVSIILGTMLGVALLGLLAFITYRAPITEFLANHYGVVAGTGEPLPLTARESALLTKMVQNGAILSQGDFLENVTSFYSNVITYLLGTIAVLGVLSIMYVVGVSKAHAATVVEQEVKNVLATRTFMSELAQEVHKHNREILDPLMTDYRNLLNENADEVTSLLQRVDAFERRVEGQIGIISATVAELDDSEDIPTGEARTVGGEG